MDIVVVVEVSLVVVELSLVVVLAIVVEDVVVVASVVVVVLYVGGVLAPAPADQAIIAINHIIPIKIIPIPIPRVRALVSPQYFIRKS